jgi:N-methylhydantoinase A
MQPTVTDANLLLGRLDEASFLGGGVQLDRKRTEEILHDRKGSLRTAEDLAAGILRVIETEMEKAIRVISVERGHDPREFTLVAFGGGGPLHACSLARALRIARVLVPAMPGALSAVGILLADTVRDTSRTVMLRGDGVESLGAIYAELEQRGIAEFAEEGLQGVAHRSIDVRYRGQGYELNVPYDAHSPMLGIEAFHRLHQQRYGFCNAHRPVEIVNVRLRMIAAGEPYTPIERKPVLGDGSAARYAEREIFFDGRLVRSRLYRREGLRPGDTIHGPAMITEYTSATVLPPGCSAEVDGFGNLVIAVAEEVRG